MPRIAALATLAALPLLAPATAHAGWRIDRATEIARIVWHHPVVDRMTIRWALLPPGSSVSAWADKGDVWFPADRPLEWEPFCSLVLHETGHLAGAQHSDRGVMAPEAVFEKESGTVNGHRAKPRWTGTDPRCRDRGRPYLEQFGLL
jgi:hypothetical protein